MIVVYECERASMKWMRCRIYTGRHKNLFKQKISENDCLLRSCIDRFFWPSQNWKWWLINSAADRKRIILKLNIVHFNYFSLSYEQWTIFISSERKYDQTQNRSYVSKLSNKSWHYTHTHTNKWYIFDMTILCHLFASLTVKELEEKNWERFIQGIVMAAATTTTAAAAIAAEWQIHHQSFPSFHTHNRTYFLSYITHFFRVKWFILSIFE